MPSFGTPYSWTSWLFDITLSCFPISVVNGHLKKMRRCSRWGMRMAARGKRSRKPLCSSPTVLQRRSSSTIMRSERMLVKSMSRVASSRRDGGPGGKREAGCEIVRRAWDFQRCYRKVGSGFVGGHYALIVRSWRLSCCVLVMWFHLSLHEKEVNIGRR